MKQYNGSMKKYYQELLMVTIKPKQKLKLKERLQMNNRELINIVKTKSNNQILHEINRIKNGKIGIYAYYDLQLHYFVYIGLDSHIDEYLRHRQHIKGNGQVIDYVLNADPDRYKLITLCTLPDGTSRETLEQYEIRYIKKLGTYAYDTTKRVFNFTLGGEGTSGYKFSDELKKIMSESRRFKSLPEETQKLLKIMSEDKDWKQKVSDGCTGKEKNGRLFVDADFEYKVFHDGSFTKINKDRWIIKGLTDENKIRPLKQSTNKEQLLQIAEYLNNGDLTISEMNDLKNSRCSAILKYVNDKIIEVI